MGLEYTLMKTSIYSCREIGLSSNFLDCDDTNAEISPDAVEVCDEWTTTAIRWSMKIRLWML